MFLKKKLNLTRPKRGKLYFYKTGPKFILTFETEQKSEQFVAEYENKEEVYEIYKPDWKIMKD